VPLGPLGSTASGNTNFRNESLRLSFRLSLEQLSDDDLDAFVWLGVLPEDVRLNPVMATTLWDQPETHTRKRLWRLRDKALLKPVGDDSYTLHDLLYDEAILRLTEQMPLPEAHAALLVRYRMRTQDDLWHTLPDDNYIFSHLTWHMEQAGWEEELHTLLQEETLRGQNSWYEARERLGQIAGYLADVTRAWRLAEEQNAIGLQCRYALMIASVNNLAQNLSPVLLTALVREKVWTQAQGLAHVRQISDSAQQAEALVRLVMARELPESSSKGHSPRAEALAGLVPHFPEQLKAQVPAEALIAVRGIEDARSRAKALVGLAPYLPEVLLREALAAAQELPERDTSLHSIRAEALAGLAPHLPEMLLGEALVAARKIENAKCRAEALAGLALRLTTLPFAAMYSLWRETLRLLTAWSRRDLLADIRALEPVIFAMGEAEAIAETFHAIQDVGRWWP
jgi:hypothetical protein